VSAADEVPTRGAGPGDRGLTGAVRRVAYALPEHRARRWGLLLAGDRLEWLGWRLGRGGRAVSVAVALALLGGLVAAVTARPGRTVR
jgi:hypothetical protein